MTIEEKKTLIRRLYIAISNNDVDTIKDIMPLDAVVHNPDPKSRDDMLTGLSWWFTMFSNNQIEIAEQVCEDDVVVTRLIWHADHTEGTYQGIVPTGKHMNIRGVGFERIKDGKIVERRIISDWTDMIQQLGLIPPQ